LEFPAGSETNAVITLITTTYRCRIAAMNCGTRYCYQWFELVIDDSALPPAARSCKQSGSYESVDVNVRRNKASCNHLPCCALVILH